MQASKEQVQAILARLSKKLEQLPDEIWTQVAPEMEHLDSSLQSLLHTINETEQGNLARLELEQHRFKALLESIPGEVWFCDLQGNITLMNKHALLNLGFDDLSELNLPINELVGDKLEVYQSDGTPRPLNESPMLRSLHGETVQGESMIRNIKTGEMHYRQHITSPVYSKDNQITGAVAFVQDITEQKRDAEALATVHEWANWMARFPGENPNPVTRVSAEGQILYCNPAASKITEWGCTDRCNDQQPAAAAAAKVDGDR